METQSFIQPYPGVAWDYREVIETEKGKKTSGKVFYFNPANQIDMAQGAIQQVLDNGRSGIFIVLDSNEKIRIDRIITMFGKPGAAYDEYDAFANACMDCNGGYQGD